MKKSVYHGDLARVKTNLEIFDIASNQSFRALRRTGRFPYGLQMLQKANGLKGQIWAVKELKSS